MTDDIDDVSPEDELDKPPPNLPEDVRDGDASGGEPDD